MAESDGWEAVTTRRLADAIGYSQPVLYGHFPVGKPEIVDAVAMQGFTEIAQAMTPVRPPRDARGAVRAVARGYLAFAAEHPAVYAAMFTRRIAASFATQSTPQELIDAFDRLAGALRQRRPAPADVETETELLWSTLHGLATLDGAARLRPSARARRLEAVVELFGGRPGD